MEQQFYQPLSAALHPPLAHAPNRSPQSHYPPYASHARPSTSNGAHHSQREEEEDDDDDEDVVEEELDHSTRDHPSTSTHSSPRVSAGHPAKRPTLDHANASALYHAQASASGRDEHDPASEDSKRKPGRPRGSRNRKPRAPATPIKAPANSQHPGFYQYPPAPGAAVAQNQQFYEFQWRALNLCSEFYNAAEELIKAAPPMVIAQCYHSGPATKVDPLGLIADAKRVCDNLLANPSQLAGQPPPNPAYGAVSSYGGMPPPAAPPSAASAPPNTGAVINNPQSFVMPLGPPGMPPPGYAQPYFPGYPPAAGARYPTAPYYPYPAQPAAPYYSPPAQSAVSTSTPAPAPAATQPTPAVSTTPAPAPAPTPAPVPAPAPAPTSVSAPAPVAASPSVPPHVPTSTSAPTSVTPTTPAIPPAPAPTSGLSAFNVATGNAAPGGTQGAWSDEETERLRKIAEQSRDTSGQTKGDIDWDWVVNAWGQSRTRHQILLKATSLGLKESTTRGQKRRREADGSDHAAPRTLPPPSPITPYTAQPQATSHVTAPSPAQSSATSNPPSANASPATQPMRPPTSIAPSAISTPRTSAQPKPASMPWPMPTLAANTPSPVMAHNQPDTTQSNYYNRHSTLPSSYSAGVSPSSTSIRPPSSHGNTANTQHHYMYRPNGADTHSSGRR